MKKAYALSMGKTVPLNEQEMLNVEGGKFFSSSWGAYLARFILKLAAKKKKKKK